MTKKNIHILTLTKKCRLLAADMRSLLCSAMNNTGSAGTETGSSSRRYHNDTAACDALLNIPGWTVDGFIKSYVDSTFDNLLHSSLRSRLSSASASGLYVPPSLLEIHQYMMGVTSSDERMSNLLQRPDDDSLLWNGPDAPAWVACNQRNKTCYGKISKQDWYSDKKTGTCIDVFSDQVKIVSECLDVTHWVGSVIITSMTDSERTLKLIVILDGALWF
jgi:hypothetical protein